MEPTNCAVCPEPKARADAYFTATSETLERLGLPAPLDGKPVRLQVCTKCYLAAMSLVLDRAGLPKQAPIPVEYWCGTCKAVAPMAEIAFIGAGQTKSTPIHKKDGQLHAITVRAVRTAAQGVAASAEPVAEGTVLGSTRLG